MFRVLREKASSFLLDDFYRTPGGIQFDGPGADTKPVTLTIEEQDYLGDIKILQDYLDKVCVCKKLHLYQPSEK
jgi:diphosphate-dependent phosphofructokinase